METVVMTDEMGMEEILAQNPDTSPGEIIEGTVVGHQDSYVIINVGLKQEASLPFGEFNSQIPPVGSKLSLLLVRVDGPQGRPLVSWRRARELKNWDVVATAFKNQQPVDGKITQKVKGGFAVDVGLDAFMPASQVDLKPLANPNDWIGKTVRVLILEMDRAKGNVLVSRRRIAEQEKAVMRTQTLESIQEGQVRKGKVTGLTNFGAFIDIGGIEGLLHTSDISWNRSENLKNLVKIGDELEVKILKYDPATHRISLGRKQLLKHPWEGLEKRFPIGSIVKGKVSGLAEFGAFVELEPGVEGLVHISEFSWTERVKKPQAVLKKGQEIETKLIGIDREKEKISLSIKRMGPSPWESVLKAHPIGSQIEGEISHFAPFGAFIKVAPGIEALLRPQDISWTDRIPSLQKIYKVGDKVKAIVLEINPQDEKMTVGVKQLSADPFKSFKVGDNVNGVVSKVTEFGLFVKLESGLEGLVRTSEIQQKKSIFSDPSDRNDRNQAAENPYKEGDAVSAMISKIQKKERKIELSIRRLEQNQEKELLKKYSQTGRLTLGETTGWTGNNEE